MALGGNTQVLLNLAPSHGAIVPGPMAFSMVEATTIAAPSVAGFVPHTCPELGSRTSPNFFSWKARRGVFSGNILKEDDKK